jgi:maltose O-acetyltransferase
LPHPRYELHLFPVVFRKRPRADITNDGAQERWFNPKERTLHIGHRLKVDGRPIPTMLQVGPSGTLRIGDRVYINYGVDILASTSVTLGDDVHIGPLCAVVDDDMHGVDPTRPRRSAPITIEANAWLARAVTVLPGVTIGADSVVAANSVVTRSLPAGVLAGGSPARVIRELSREEGWQRK